jgi:uncharacterized protein YeaO (DUF488 family)
MARMDIRTKRVYEAPSPEDGYRILVDKVWPRGLSPEKAQVNRWERDLAPSMKLRRWYSNDPTKWPEFRRLYTKQLGQKTRNLNGADSIAPTTSMTLLYTEPDMQRNAAAVLREYLLHRMVHRESLAQGA